MVARSATLSVGETEKIRQTKTGSSQESFSDGGTSEVDKKGDLILQIHHGELSHAFRVQSAVLRSKSAYFSSLLSGRFGEASNVEQQRSSLRERYGDLANAPTQELPSVKIEDLGRISAVKSLSTLGTDFFKVLHGHDLLPNPPPVANLANLAVVADRFGALDSVGAFASQKKILRAIDGKTTAKTDDALSEEKIRQRLLVALMVEHAPWLERYSLRLVTKGWVGKVYPESTPLWWDLPAGIEDEMLYRRECVLQTIQSLQDHFISLYSSRERQCKLGYDSSPQCDSFQLGELIRFFMRAGTVQIQGTIADAQDPPHSGYNGDIQMLLDGLRQVSEYQIDRNHNHCGIRTRIVPILDMIAICVMHVGICGDCWQEDRFRHAWVGANRPLVWRRQDVRLRQNLSHKEWHSLVQAMFTATTKDWS